MHCDHTTAHYKEQQESDCLCAQHPVTKEMATGIKSLLINIQVLIIISHYKIILIVSPSYRLIPQ